MFVISCLVFSSWLKLTFIREAYSKLADYYEFRPTLTGVSELAKFNIPLDTSYLRGQFGHQSFHACTITDDQTRNNRKKIAKITKKTKFKVNKLAVVWRKQKEYKMDWINGCSGTQAYLARG